VKQCTSSKVSTLLQPSVIYTAQLYSHSSFDPLTSMMGQRVPCPAPEASTLVAPEGPTLVAPEASTLVAPEGPTLAAPEGPTLVAPEGPTLVAPEGSMLNPKGLFASMMGHLGRWEGMMMMMRLRWWDRRNEI